MSDPHVEVATTAQLQQLTEVVVAHEREQGRVVDPAAVLRYLDVALAAQEEELVLRLTARRGDDEDPTAVVMELERWGLSQGMAVVLLQEAVTRLAEGEIGGSS